MRDVVDRAIDDQLVDEQYGSIVSAYVIRDGEHAHYFSLITTRDLPQFEHKPTDSTHIECLHAPIDQFRSIVPNEREVESSTRQLSVQLIDDSTWELSVRSDVRMV